MELRRTPLQRSGGSLNVQDMNPLRSFAVVALS